MNRTIIKDTAEMAGQEVLLKGWVHARRDMGKIVFIDLRDRSGIVQTVFIPQNKEAYETAQELRPEFVVEIKGIVNERPAKQINKDIITGTVEVLASELKILNEAKTPPFEINNETDVSEELRLKYRYLDLRRKRMKNIVVLRDRAVNFFREYLRGRRFIEVETPILTKGTPEGAREYIVPSRLYEGKFYVLPQSPQQFKQLLMVAGIERYFQIAKCFRDEDQRGDRQPEFTQLDMEMSFMSQEEILALVEEMFVEMVKTVTPEKRITRVPFPRLTYKESMEKYGTDKPDLREDKEDPDELAFCFIVDMPMFEHSEDGRLGAQHHPFTSPKEEDIHLLDESPEKVRANSYDLALNGYELASGSIRIHQRDLQNKIFEILGISEEQIKLRFGHLLEAFEYGAPPHGGIAPGIDRLVMILAGEPNIREVIIFPKTGDAQDLMMGAPSELEEKRLTEANIEIRKQ